MRDKRVRLTVNNVDVRIASAMNFYARRLNISRDQLLNELFTKVFGEVAEKLEAARLSATPVSDVDLSGMFHDDRIVLPDDTTS